MSRDDEIKEHRVTLGMCDCPTSPHAEDFAMVRDRHDYASLSVLTSAAIDEGAFLLQLIRDGIRSWNLVTRGDAEGTLVPLAVTDTAVDRLSANQKMCLLADIKAADFVLGLHLPNPPAARSGSGRAARSVSKTSRKRSATL